MNTTTTSSTTSTTTHSTTAITTKTASQIPVQSTTAKEKPMSTTTSTKPSTANDPIFSAAPEFGTDSDFAENTEIVVKNSGNERGGAKLSTGEPRKVDQGPVLEQERLLNEAEVEMTTKRSVQESFQKTTTDGEDSLEGQAISEKALSPPIFAAEEAGNEGPEQTPLAKVEPQTTTRPQESRLDSLLTESEEEEKASSGVHLDKVSPNPIKGTGSGACNDKLCQEEALEIALRDPAYATSVGNHPGGYVSPSITRISARSSPPESHDKWHFSPIFPCVAILVIIGLVLLGASLLICHRRRSRGSFTLVRHEDDRFQSTRRSSGSLRSQESISETGDADTVLTSLVKQIES